MSFKRFYWLYKVDLPYRLGSIQNRVDKNLYALFTYWNSAYALLRL